MAVNQNVPLSEEQALHYIRLQTDQLESLIASSYMWDASTYAILVATYGINVASYGTHLASYEALLDVEAAISASYGTHVASYGVLQEIEDWAEASYGMEVGSYNVLTDVLAGVDSIDDTLGEQDDAEALAGDGTIVALLKALRTLVQQPEEVYHDYSGVKAASISYGAYSPTYPIDLGAIYDIIRVFCQDSTYVPVGTYMEMQVCVSYPAYNMMPLCEQDSPGTEWYQTAFLPTSGGFDFILTHAAATRWLLPSLTNPAEGAILLYMYGVHRST